MDTKDFENEMYVWMRRMSVTPYGSGNEICKKFCKGKRKALWQQIIGPIRPSFEVEHIKKNLALKKALLKQKLRKQLKEKEESTRIMEHDFEQSSQRLRVLNCNVQAIKQRTKELGIKTMLICCKKQDMEHKAVMYQHLSQVTNFLKHSSSFGSGDTGSSHDKHMQICQNVINKAEIQVHELHNLYRMNDLDLPTVNAKKEAVIQFVQHSIKDIPVYIVWQAMLDMMSKLNAELRDLIQNSIGRETHQFVPLKEKADAELHRFMFSYLELGKHHYQLHQRVAACKSECNDLLDKAVQALQEKLYLVKQNEDIAHIKMMLELEMRIAELHVTKMIFQNEIKNLKSKQCVSEVVDPHKDEADKFDAKIGQLEASIKTNYVWLTKSYSNQNKVHESLQQLLAILPKMCSLDKCGETNLDLSMKELQSAFQLEFKEFMELPLHVFDSLTLPSGVTLPRSQQTLKYNLNLAQLAQSNDLPNILTILNGAPSASPHSIVLQTLENKLYLDALTSSLFSSNLRNASSENINVTSMQHTENVTIAVIADVIDSMKTSIARCKNIRERAENNFRAWVEHPFQSAVPERLKLHEKSMKQWQDCYDSLLASLGDIRIEDLNVKV